MKSFTSKQKHEHNGVETPFQKSFFRKFFLSSVDGLKPFSASSAMMLLATRKYRNVIGVLFFTNNRSIKSASPKFWDSEFLFAYVNCAWICHTKIFGHSKHLNFGTFAHLKLITLDHVSFRCYQHKMVAQHWAQIRSIAIFMPARDNQSSKASSYCRQK